MYFNDKPIMGMRMGEFMKPEVKKAVFPAAGLATRLLPATKAMPKEMLTIVDRPLIQLAVEEAVEAGIEEFIFVISRDKDSLIRHFTAPETLLDALHRRGKFDQIEKIHASTLPAHSVKVVYQDDPKGLGDAVLCARELVGNEPFAVILPDDTVRSDQKCLSQMMECYEKTGGNVIATCEIPLDQSSKYGILDFEAHDGRIYNIRKLVEKPEPELAPSNMAIFGRYILQPTIFEFLATQQRGAGGEIQLTDAMARMIESQEFYGFEFKGERLDCGNDMGFVKAQIAFAMENPLLAPEIADYMTEKLREYHYQAAKSVTDKSSRQAAKVA